MNFYQPGEDDPENEEPELHVGTGESVVIDKMYGPLVMAGLRITADQASCAWIIERQVSESGWQEWVRIPGQLDIDFRFPWEWNPHMIVGGQETIDRVAKR